MKKFKLPTAIKITYILALILMIAGIASINVVTVSTATIILCVLSTGSYILQSIHELKAGK